MIWKIPLFILYFRQKYLCNDLTWISNGNFKCSEKTVDKFLFCDLA